MSSRWESFNEWVRINASLGMDKLLQNLVVVFGYALLTAILLGILTFVAIALPDFVRAETLVPNSFLVILILFALIGVMVPSWSMFRIITRYFQNSDLEYIPREEFVNTIEFEDFPRLWTATILKQSGSVKVNEIQVWCSRHNLQLEPIATAVPTFLRSYVVSYCETCGNEGYRYDGNWPPGAALHDSVSTETLLNNIEGMFRKKLAENAEKK
ncbi:MAG: hypothetical protein DWQ07_09665 [Chloroflexi bacterium]|nr:MAG: hypothetical protein DWQ07_09665 [Chloroflexota bacterium]MBL1193019.1 hypothetical protein [Chloroflexota bacterium]